MAGVKSISTRFKGKAIKVIKCPSCNRCGLQTRTDRFSNIKVKCKECNSFWNGKEALKIWEQVKKAKAKIVRESNKRRYKKDRLSFNSSIRKLQKKGFILLK